MLLWFCLQVWFQNRRAKFRKQERLAQQKASSQTSSGETPASGVKSEVGKVNVKEMKPATPTTPTSSHSGSGGDVKPVNGAGMPHTCTSAVACCLTQRRFITENTLLFQFEQFIFKHLNKFFFICLTCTRK